MKKNIDKKTNRILDEIVSKINLGYTHENFVEIGTLIKMLEPILERNEILCLESAWRDSYTDSCDSKTLEKQINKIKSRTI